MMGCLVINKELNPFKRRCPTSHARSNIFLTSNRGSARSLRRFVMDGVGRLGRVDSHRHVPPLADPFQNGRTYKRNRTVALRRERLVVEFRRPRDGSALRAAVAPLARVVLAGFQIKDLRNESF